MAACSRCSADGYLDITGRTKGVIIRGGENIPVAYVENVLYEHPDVAAVALVGLPDPRLQERACAVVVLNPKWRRIPARGSRWTTCVRSSPGRAWPGSTCPSGWS
ncbi:MAG: AMP-binding enzyme [Pseudonocardia sp.]